MVEFIVRIQACPGALASPACGVRRIDKEHSRFLCRIFVNGLNAVSMNKRDFLPDMFDVLNALAPGFGVPAGLKEL